MDKWRNKINSDKRAFMMAIKVIDNVHYTITWYLMRWETSKRSVEYNNLAHIYTINDNMTYRTHLHITFSNFYPNSFVDLVFLSVLSMQSISQFSSPDVKLWLSFLSQLRSMHNLLVDIKQRSYIFKSVCIYFGMSTRARSDSWQIITHLKCFKLLYYLGIITTQYYIIQFYRLTGMRFLFKWVYFVYLKRTSWIRLKLSGI